MSAQIIWPPSPDVASYEVQRAAVPGGPYDVIATVPNDITGANYDPTAQVFSCVDPDGDPRHWYRLVAIDATGTRSLPSAPSPGRSPPAAITTTVKLDHDYGTKGALRYQSTSGVPIQGAAIRVFQQSDFESGATSVPLAVTQTDTFGNWVAPVFVASGFSYVVQFSLDGQYGPDLVTVVV